MEASQSDPQHIFQNRQHINATDMSILEDQGGAGSVDTLLSKIFGILNSPRNHRDQNPHKSSISIQQTHQSIKTTCKCKKSKCLKLYCQCFAQGLFCNGCNCICCENKEEFTETRAKAIDNVLSKAQVPFGHRNSSIKGCNCKKTGCLKKYCECYGGGDKCSEYCKCSNCQNS